MVESATMWVHQETMKKTAHYVSSNGLGQWTAATSYFWQRAIAGCGDDDEVWVFNNMLKRYGYEDGYRRGEEIPEDALLPYKNCTKLLNLLKKHIVEYDIADGTSTKSTYYATELT